MRTHVSPTLRSARATQRSGDSTGAIALIVLCFCATRKVATTSFAHRSANALKRCVSVTSSASETVGMSSNLGASGAGAADESVAEASDEKADNAETEEDEEVDDVDDADADDETDTSIAHADSLLAELVGEAD